MSEGDLADRADSTVPGDQRRGGDDIQVLPAGLVRMSDPRVPMTARDGPPTVARPIAYRGRVTLFHAREKVGKSTLLRAAVAAVTRGTPFLKQSTIPGCVLWVGEEAIEDVKGQLFEAGANLDQVYFIRRLNRDPGHESSLPRLVALLRPVWVIIDTWQHHLKTHRVTDTAGPGEQGLLLGDVVDIAQQYEAAITVSHHNSKNKPHEYRDSTALGAVADMIVSFDRGEQLTVRRLRPSGRWPVDPVDIRWERGVGYEVVQDAEQAKASSRQTRVAPMDDRVLLYLFELDPDAKPSARALAAALRCQGRRYEQMSEGLKRLVGERLIDRAQRQGSTSSRDRGYALTPAGRRRAESLRGTFSTSRQEMAPSNGTTVSERPAVEVSGNGNAAATPAEAEEGQPGRAAGGDVDEIDEN